MHRFIFFLVLSLPLQSWAGCSGSLLGQWNFFIQYSIKVRTQKFAKDNQLHIAQQILERQKTIRKIKPLESRLYPLYIREWNINRDEILKYATIRESGYSFEDIIADPTLVETLNASDLLWLQAKVNQQIIERRFLLANASWEKIEVDYLEALYTFTRLQNDFADLDKIDLRPHYRYEHTPYTKLFTDYKAKKAKWIAARQAVKDLNASLDALKKAYPNLFSKDKIVPHSGFYPETEEDCIQERRNFIDDYAQNGLKT